MMTQKYIIPQRDLSHQSRWGSKDNQETQKLKDPNEINYPSDLFSRPPEFKSRSTGLLSRFSSINSKSKKKSNKRSSSRSLSNLRTHRVRVPNSSFNSNSNSDLVTKTKSKSTHRTSSYHRDHRDHRDHKVHRDIKPEALIGEAIMTKYLRSKSAQITRSCPRYSEIDNNSDFYSRGGVIPYYQDPRDSKIYFCFGIDRRGFYLTDFGGGRYNDETVAECALREYKEESYNCCGSFELKDIEDCYVLEGVHDLTILVPSAFSPLESFLLFRQGQEKDSDYELDNIVWLSQAQLRATLTSYPPLFPFNFSRSRIPALQIHREFILSWGSGKPYLHIRRRDLQDLIDSYRGPDQPDDSHIHLELQITQKTTFDDLIGIIPFDKNWFVAWDQSKKSLAATANIAQGVNLTLVFHQDAQPLMLNFLHDPMLTFTTDQKEVYSQIQKVIPLRYNSHHHKIIHGAITRVFNQKELLPQINKIEQNDHVKKSLQLAMIFEQGRLSSRLSRSYIKYPININRMARKKESFERYNLFFRILFKYGKISRWALCKKIASQLSMDENTVNRILGHLVRQGLVKQVDYDLDCFTVP